MDTNNPKVSKSLKAFFHVELRNAVQMNRDAALGEGFIATLGSALGSWEQVPNDVMEEWLDLPPLPDTTELLLCELSGLVRLGVEHGFDAPLVDFL